MTQNTLLLINFFLNGDTQLKFKIEILSVDSFFFLNLVRKVRAFRGGGLERERNFDAERERKISERVQVYGFYGSSCELRCCTSLHKSACSKTNECAAALAKAGINCNPFSSDAVCDRRTLILSLASCQIALELQMKADACRCDSRFAQLYMTHAYRTLICMVLHETAPMHTLLSRGLHN
jgi:hypothetical protein